tara:strand:+ start:2482 stop:2913 length:432 start_codon:yes stop_codon:yes gene_type:complete
MTMPAQDHANLTITIALAHAAKGQGFTLTAAHAAGVTIPTRPGRAGWADRWADRVADEVLAHLALADAVDAVLAAASRPHFSMGEYDRLTADGEDLQALQKERRLDAARSAAGASTIVALTEGEAMGHPDWGVSAAWDLLTDA